MIGILILLAVVQGLTEFLPVSSSGHLAIAASFFPSIEQDQLLYFLVLHAGTACATIIYFRNDIINILKGLFEWLACDKNENSREAFQWLKLIVFISIPTAIAGFGLRHYVNELSHSLIIVGSLLCVTAILLFITKFLHTREKDLMDFGIKEALLIGLAQSFALLPGISRSGSTIVMALILGANPSFAGKLSFLASFAPIFGALLLEVSDYLKTGEEQLSLSYLLIGFVSAFVVGLLALRVLMNLLKQRKLHYFALYCVLLGLSVILYTVLRRA